MALATSVLIFGAIGFALAAATIGYVTALRDRFLSEQGPPQLAPFEIVGVSAPEVATLRTALPRMVIAHLQNLKTRANDAIDSLAQARLSLDQSATAPAALSFAEILVPERLQRSIDLDIKVADVELGWLFSLLLKQTRSQRILEVTLSFDQLNKRTHVYGSVPGDQGYSFTLELTTDLKDIVNGIAGVILQKATRGHHVLSDALEPSVFQLMVDALADYAHLERQRRVATPDPAAYNEILTRLRPHVARLNKWEDFQWLTAQLSERAHDWELARISYSNLLGLTPQAHANFAFLEAKVTSFGEHAKSRETGPPTGATVAKISEPSAPGRPSHTPSDDSGKTIDATLAKPFAETLRLNELQNTSNIKIAVIGGAPWVAADDTSITLLGSKDANFGTKSMRDYQTELLQAIRLFARESKFIYTPLMHEGDFIATTDMLAGLHQLINDDANRPNMLLLTYSSAVPSMALNHAIKSMPPDIFVVVAAGNDGNAEEPVARISTYADIADKALVVGSVSRSGRRSSWSSVGAGLVFAPGDDIPVISATTGRQALRSGTAFAAAVAAGAVSNLFAAYPNEAATRIHKAIQDSATGQTNSDAPRILNVAGAAKLLEEMK